MSVYEKENPDYLDQSLKSMVNQTITPNEIVLVEDGPLNNALNSVIEKYQRNYPSLLVLVKLPVNKGLGYALNQGLNVVRNELVARMDSDDISFPERCEKQIKAFEKNPQLSIVGTQIDEFIESTDNIVSSRIVPSSYKEIQRFSKRRSPFNHPTVMFRKSAVEAVGGYKAFGRKEDLDLFIRMINEGFKAINLKKSYLFYRTSPDNLQRRKNWVNCKEYIQIMYGFHKKGWNNVGDMIYVVAGQCVMYFAPAKIVDILSNKLLRERK